MTHPTHATDPGGCAGADTLVALLAARAAAHGDRVALTHLERGERIADEITYAGLDRQARSVARSLVAAGLAGKPVLLCLPSGLDFIRCFFGCLYAGAYAAPAPAPESRRGQDRIVALMRDLRPAGMLISKDIDGASVLEALPPGCVVIDAADALAVPPAEGLESPCPDDLAFIQYTSGSLGNPRGIAITHRNIMANQAMIREAFGHGPDLRAVNWLPMHHDMGLIGSVLHPLYVGGCCFSMSPFSFLQKPIRWLRAIGTFGCTSSGGPNFAFDLCARRIPAGDLRGLELSSWNVAFCGSEPVRPDTLKTFAHRFRAHGFDEKALLPCYGLAEATLFVSGVAARSGLRARDLAVETTSCGRAFGGSEIVVLGDTGEPAGEGDTGEICVAGDHVSPGFWDGEAMRPARDPAREATISGRRFLRTGDVGTLLAGELYVVGRSRDTIIVRGTKIHAEDIEATAHAFGQQDGLTAAAAFAVAHEATEQLILVCEVQRPAWQAMTGKEMQALVRMAIGEAHGIIPRQILFVRPGAIPRSINGKIRRSACRELYLAGALDGHTQAGSDRQAGAA